MNTVNATKGVGQAPVRPPLQQFLEDCHARFSADISGEVADYIPELKKANPDHFGISLASIDGHLYEVGDTDVPFTIQSMSKAFVFALALDSLGASKVEAVIGVEPSGDAFNSIRLNADNKPFNAMVNAGAITCSGLIATARGEGAFEFIRQGLSRFAGRELGVDEAVYASERATGDRNRAIGYLLRNSSVIRGDVGAVLDVYFRQCSILVTARDIAVMAATLANRGLNPLTGDQVVAPYAIARTLSVMTTAGMYDFAGEWIYRVGIPAKSGVGGGILAALPSQFGFGSFSPRLDPHGNSVRGIQVCEVLSAHFDLHMLNRNGNSRTSVIADYDIGRSSSRRSRRADEHRILDQHHSDVRVIELVGSLSFATIDYISRQFAAKPLPQILIIDFRRVADVSSAAARLLADGLRGLERADVTMVLSGLALSSLTWEAISQWTEGMTRVRNFVLLDEAIEWAEDQIIYRHGGHVDHRNLVPLAEQALLAGLTPDDLNALAGLGTERQFRAGEIIIRAGAQAQSLFFLHNGQVSIRLPSGVRLAALTGGMVVGEMALLDATRTADAIADTDVACLEVLTSQLRQFSDRRPRVGEQIMHNLAALLAGRLTKANAKVDLLSSD
jgi:glutaminase